MSARRLAVRPVLGVLHLLPGLSVDSGSPFGRLHLGSILRGLNSVPGLCTFISTLFTVTNASSALIVDNAGAGRRALPLAHVDNQAFLCEGRRHREQQRRERTEAEFVKLLDNCGFTLERVIPTPTPIGIVEASPK